MTRSNYPLLKSQIITVSSKSSQDLELDLALESALRQPLFRVHTYNRFLTLNTVKSANQNAVLVNQKLMLHMTRQLKREDSPSLEVSQS